MSWLIITLLFSFSSAKAFNDKAILALIETTKITVNKLSSDQLRIAELKRFKDKLHGRLSEFDLPYVESMDDDDPRLSEIASLTEFEVYMDQINFSRRISAKACYDSASRIHFHRGRSDSVKSIPNEALKALEILEMFCKDRK